MTVEELQCNVKRGFPGADIRVERLPSGTTFVDIFFGKEWVQVEISSRVPEVGVSSLADRMDMDWSGHDEAFPSLDEAAPYALSLLARSGRRPTTETPQVRSQR